MTAAEFVPGPDDGLDGAIIELTVGPVAHGGHCTARLGREHRSELASEERTAPRHRDTARHEGMVVFVRHALPGERVRAVVTESTSSYLRADAVAVLEPSPRRVEAPCPYVRRVGRESWAGRSCGGCDWQHADPAYQRELKTAVLREQLCRLGGLTESEVERLEPAVRPVPGVPGEPAGLGWRTRVQYTVDSQGRAGLLAHRSHEVVPVDHCLIAHPSVRRTDALARAWPDEDGVEVVRSTVLRRLPGAAPAVVSGPATVTEHAVGRQWSLLPEAFWQVHPAAADTLARDVVELLAPRPGDRIWDLYGGAGLFAAALAPHASGTGRLTVVEADPAAVAAARENLRDLTTVTVVHADVARALANPRWRAVDLAGGRSMGGPDLVVLDPPRTGAGAVVVAAIAARRPRAVAYVACDPAALARDVRTFRSHGYSLAALRPYDLFPHTHHLECVALLRPSSEGEPGS